MDEKIILLELHKKEKQYAELTKQTEYYIQQIRQLISTFVLDAATEEDLDELFQVIYRNYPPEDNPGESA